MVDTTGEWRATVTPVDSSSTGQAFDDGQAVVFQFIRAGDAGTSGSSGSSGTAGSSGNAGAAGNAGSSGTSGSSGSSGNTGNSGTSGTSGSSGNAGAAGNAGSSGTSGSSGSSGNTGNSGTSGTSGSSGNAGASGTSGSSGNIGNSGTSGTSGSSGNSGTSGSSGNSGSSGTSGSSGSSGNTGGSGTSGSSGLEGLAHWTTNDMSNVTKTDAHEFTGGSNSWTNTRVTSTQGFTRGCYVSWTRGASSTKHYIFGLDDDPPTGSINYNNIDYCWQVAASATYYTIRENGSSTTIYMTTASTDVLMITYDGLNVRWWVNGVLKKTVARSIGNPLYLTSSFYTSGSIAENVVFGPIGAVADADTGGVQAKGKIQLANIGISSAPYLSEDGTMFNVNISGSWPSPTYRRAPATDSTQTGDAWYGNLIITFTNPISTSKGVPFAYFSTETDGAQGVNCKPCTVIEYSSTSMELYVGPYNTAFTVYFAVL
jgi:hypothetical protein